MEWEREREYEMDRVYVRWSGRGRGSMRWTECV